MYVLVQFIEKQSVKLIQHLASFAHSCVYVCAHVCISSILSLRKSLLGSKRKVRKYYFTTFISMSNTDTNILMTAQNKVIMNFIVKYIFHSSELKESQSIICMFSAITSLT